ncbi:MAG: ribosome maturation factor RimP [Ileibacterium sp.]|nr:ribosome maturation factor RimP [Ileibacterium sp.]
METLKSWLVPLLKEHGCRLYDVEWDKSMKPPVLRISIEKEDGSMDLDTCAEMSDLISARLDDDDHFTEEYMLEVCSPGAERELRSAEEIDAALGKHVYVKLKEAKDGLQDVTGDLKEITPETITVSYFVKGRPKKAVIARDNIALIMTAVKF